VTGADAREEETAALTLPDLIRGGLAVVFVGINPSIYSATKGHYFARPGNRFWPALSRSSLSRGARRALGVAALGPEHDRQLLAHGFGFTDLVKRATVRASDLSDAEFAAGAARLQPLLERHAPRLACFLGITHYRRIHRLVAADQSPPQLGLQPQPLGRTRLFVVPSPSGANAHASRAEQTLWFDRLAELAGMEAANGGGRER
jgi:double-stranded uracil-DNA glycosylase